MRLNYVNERGHGGGCCGVSHIYRIPRYSNEAVEELKNATKYFSGPHTRTGGCRLIEIVLTERKDKRWHEALIDIGYRVATKFRNNSTENILYVYHYYIPVE